MAVINTHFLNTILNVHVNILNQISYPFFDTACTRYEALRAVLVDRLEIQTTIEKYGLTEYDYRKSLKVFRRHGVAGLIGIDSIRLTEELPTHVERMVFVLKKARPWIPATKMSLILKGFNYNIPVSLMRHLYASYGWARGTKPYELVDFYALNLKVIQLCKLSRVSITRESFFNRMDKLQNLLEVFRTLKVRGITSRYPGSRVSFQQHKQAFLSLGLLGLIDKARPPFRNSKLGFRDEGWIIFSKIQNLQKSESHYLKILKSQGINVDSTCLTKIFTKWKVKDFQSKYRGDISRLMEPEANIPSEVPVLPLPVHRVIRLDKGFINFLKDLGSDSVPLANPGIFLFLPYLNHLRIFEKVSSLMDMDPDRGYSWFSLLLLNLGRIFEGLCSVSKACQIHELSLPLMAGLVGMPSKDSFLNGLASINDADLLSMRRYLTQVLTHTGLIKAKRIAFDFHMRDFTSDDVELKNIGKGPSPKRKICFPGFRPHLAWDVDTGIPISLEFRNGKARATTTIKRFIRELIADALGDRAVEHVYLDSEYTAESVWQFMVDPYVGFGADLTICIKRNKRVKQYIKTFLETNPKWLFYDEDHTYSEQTFSIPIRKTDKILKCVLKRKESNGSLRCFGSTITSLDSKGILKEYRHRWVIENGIKDLVENYFFDNIPGIDPHRINIHYFVVTLARSLYEMLCNDYEEAQNHDGTKKTISTLRSEFITGTNAVLSRVKNELVVMWKDPYPEKYHKVIKALFDKLNKESQVLPFLGGLKMRFEIAQPKPELLRNQFKREFLEI